MASVMTVARQPPMMAGMASEIARSHTPAARGTRPSVTRSSRNAADESRLAEKGRAKSTASASTTIRSVTEP